MARIEWTGKVDGKRMQLQIESTTASPRAWKLFLSRLERGIFASEMERAKRLATGKKVPPPTTLYNNPFMAHFWHMMDQDDS